MDLYVLLQMVPVGGYVSGYKIMPLLLITLLWWRLLTWVDKDTLTARLPREIVNAGMVGAFVLGMLLFLFIPAGFWIAFPIYIIIMAGSVGAYISIRQKQVGLKDLISDLKDMRIFRAGAKKTDDTPGMVTLTTKDGKVLLTPEGDSPERPAYDVLQSMLTEPLRRRADRLKLEPLEGASQTQYWVDGVMYTGAQFNRATASAAITVLKRLASLDLNEKRKPQSAFIQATIDGRRHEVRVHTDGSAAGESLRLMVNPRSRHELKLDQMGFTAAQLEQIDKVVGDPSGVVLIAVPRGQGLTALCYGMIRKHDAFLSHIQSIEREPEDDLEGITQNKLDRAATPADELHQVQWVISQEPDAILMPAVQNPKSLRELIAYAKSGRRVYIGMHTGSAIDAITEWRGLVGDDELAVKHLRMIVAGRLLRKLCPACKQPYQPDSETLRKLNFDHGSVQQFFQARTQPLVDQKGNPIACTFCAEMRYHGRTGVYEVMEINDEMRQAILANSSANQLRAVFRKARGRFVQEQALHLVETGDTSIHEVLRAMRGDDKNPHGGAGPASQTGTFAPAGPGPSDAAGPSQRPQSPGKK